jgi:hypothetical protein
MDRAMNDALFVHFPWQNIGDFILKGVCHGIL